MKDSPDMKEFNNENLPIGTQALNEMLSTYVETYFKKIKEQEQVKEQKCQDLRRAVVNKDFPQVKLFLEEGINPNFISIIGEEPLLILALKNHDMKLSSLLISYGTDTNARGILTGTPLILTLSEKDINGTKLLISWDTNILTNNKELIYRVENAHVIFEGNCYYRATNNFVGISDISKEEIHLASLINNAYNIDNILPLYFSISEDQQPLPASLLTTLTSCVDTAQHLSLTARFFHHIKKFFEATSPIPAKLQLNKLCDSLIKIFGNQEDNPQLCNLIIEALKNFKNYNSNILEFYITYKKTAIFNLIPKDVFDTDILKFVYKNYCDEYLDNLHTELLGELEASEADF